MASYNLQNLNLIEVRGLVVTESHSPKAFSLFRTPDLTKEKRVNVFSKKMHPTQQSKTKAQPAIKSSANANTPDQQRRAIEASKLFVAKPQQSAGKSSGARLDSQRRGTTQQHPLKDPEAFSRMRSMQERLEPSSGHVKL